MNIHTTTGRWRLGLGLSLLTAFFWAILPIAVKGVLKDMDVYTITWYRFSVSTVLLAVFTIPRNGLPSINRLRGSALWLAITAIVCLCGNHILYLFGLYYLSPSSITVVIQLAPMFLLMGGLILFKEHFNIFQWGGLTVLVFGMILFFNQRLGELLHSLNDYTIGVLITITSALIWSIYALAQKQLLKEFPSKAILLLIYTGGGLLFLPLARPARIFQLDNIQLLLLAFCAVNTLIAYGSFAEALNHWEASRVSAVLATIPLITIVAMEFISALFPHFINPEQLNAMSIAGAIIVVAGSMLCALSQNRPKLS